MLTLATLVMAVRPHAKNPAVSNEALINSLLSPYVKAGDVRNKYGDEYSLDKQAVSRLMNGKTDVPRALRGALERACIETETTENMRVALLDLVSPWEYGMLETQILNLMEEGDPRRKALEAQRNDAAEFLSLALLQAIRAENVPRDRVLLWHEGSGSLTLRAGDLLDFGFRNRRRNRNIIVVPVDTTFETRVSSPGDAATVMRVSRASVHGQWLERMKSSGVRRYDIQRRLSRSLTRKAGSPDPAGRYPRGTVAEYVTERAVYYLVALSEFDECGRAVCSSDDVACVLRGLASYYDRRGQGSPLYLPLVGVGLSGALASEEESLKLIRVAFTSGECFARGAVTIVAQREVFIRLAHRQPY